MENCIQLVGQLLSVVQLPANMVLSLLRQASQALTVEGVEVLQVQVTGKHHPEQIGPMDLPSLQMLEHVTGQACFQLGQTLIRV